MFCICKNRFQICNISNLIIFISSHTQKWTGTVRKVLADFAVYVTDDPIAKLYVT